MDHKTKQTAMKSLAGILLSIVLYVSSGIHIPVLDAAADSYFKDSITKAGVSYGVCRVINATVSVIQQSSLQLEPAGIGLSLAVGQIVDPINDMAERLSSLLVMSIASLGVQELAYEISITLVPPILAVFLLVLSILVWFKNPRIIKLQRIVVSVVLLASIARFCLPLSSLANEFLQQTFFEDEITEANGELSRGTSDLDTLKEVRLPEYDGFMGTIENSASYLKQKSVDFKKAITATLENKRLIIDNLLRLTFLYLGVFIIQVLVLPLLVFWLLMRIVNALFLGTTMSTLGYTPSAREAANG